jgi:hypothetical protein
MPSTSEKGHAKNVDNFSLLIEVCKGFGTKYNPSKASIKVANLTIKLNQSKTQLQDVKDKDQAESTARNNRAIAFKDKGIFSTKLLAAIKATDATDETIADAISINKKIQGERLTADKKAKPTTEGAAEETPKTISTSQLSYTNIVDHYKKFKTLLTSIATIYTPNEAELQTSAVNTYITNLETLNNTVDTAATAASNSLIARDKGFYDEKTGLPETAQDVKEYIKSVYGASSPEYKMAAKIKFTYPPKK